MTHCSTQLDFPFFKDADVTAKFDAGDVVTDPGLLLMLFLGLPETGIPGLSETAAA